jgi:hypothetical protein
MGASAAAYDAVPQYWGGTPPMRQTLTEIERQQCAGIDATIEPPGAWKDPIPDQ